VPLVQIVCRGCCGCHVFGTRFVSMRWPRLLLQTVRWCLCIERMVQHVTAAPLCRLQRHSADWTCCCDISVESHLTDFVQRIGCCCQLHQVSARM
jgi:hypothetical protein